MARAAGGPKPQPANALLGRLDGIEPQVVAHGEREAADLANRLGHPFEDVRAIADEPLRPVPHASLLVGEEQHDDLAARADAGTAPAAHDGEDHPAHVLHVDSSAAPDEALVDLGSERRVAPVGADRRNHIDMTVQQHRRRGGICARHPQVHPGPRRACRREDLRSPAGLAQHGRAVLGSIQLPHRQRTFAVIARVDPEKALGQFDDVGFGFGQRIPGHGVILHHRARSRSPDANRCRYAFVRTKTQHHVRVAELADALA